MRAVVSQECAEQTREASAPPPGAAQASPHVSRAINETLGIIRRSCRNLERLKESVFIPRRHLEHSDFWRRAGGKMNRTMVERHLAQAERHVARGKEIVAEQRERVAMLERDGHDAAQARELLRKFEELQGNHIADRNSLRQELHESANDL